MHEQIRRDYYNWIVSLVCDWCDQYGDYQKLITFLQSVIFEYGPDDEARAEEGVEFRLRFADETPYSHRDVLIFLNEPCTMLEMMVALSFKIEESIMYDFDIGDRTSDWFFEMLESSHLDILDDDHFSQSDAEIMVSNIMNRRYSRNGDGGLFRVHNNRDDMRRASIWFQMSWHFGERL